MQTEKREGVKLGGTFNIKCFDPSGNLKWEETAHNIVTNAGLNHILDVVLHAQAQTTVWYVGLKATGAVAAGDTLPSHAGWAEATEYAGTRKEFVEATAAQQMSNTAAPATFAISTDVTVAGAFLASTDAGTTGTLLCAVDFASEKVASSGDSLSVSYTITAADDGV